MTFISRWTILVSSSAIRNFCPRSLAPIITSPSISTTQSLFSRSKSSKKRTSSSVKDEDEDDDWEELPLDSTYSDVGRDYKDVVTSLSSLRLDTVLKSGIGLPNSKIESAFYDSRIRLNGTKALKKSVSVHLGDEADIIVGLNAKNKEFVDVMRVVLRALRNRPDKERIQVKLRRFKHLTIVNYPHPNSWKQTLPTEEE